MTSKAYRENYAQIKWARPTTVRTIRNPAGRAIYIISDIEPYRSPITDEVIGGRRQHREHMRAHDVIERGNEPIRPNKPEPLPSAREDVHAAMEMVRSGYRPQRSDTYED